MRFSCVQTKTNFGLEYKFMDKFGAVVSTVTSPFARGRRDVFLEFFGHGPMELYFNPNDTSRGDSLTARLAFYALRGPEYVGRFVGSIRKTGKLFFHGYPYYDMTFDDEAYEMYAIGVSGDGLYLQIVCGDKTVAMARKSNVVVDYKDNYDLVLASEEYLPLAAAALVYYDITTFEDMEEMSVRSVKRNAANYGTHKALLEKFDREFWENN